MVSVTKNLNQTLAILALEKSGNFSYIPLAKIIVSVESQKRHDSSLITYNKYEYYIAPEMRSNSKRSAA